MTEETKAVANTISQTALANIDIEETFDCVGAEDLVASRIKICQAMSQVDHTKIANGNWYDTTSSEDKGKEINFFLLSKKDVKFTNINERTGLEEINEGKELLVVGEDLGFPYIVQLSVTGYFPLKGLLTSLVSKLKGKSMPIFGALIKAGTELTTNKKGQQYFIPTFKGVRLATDDEIVKLKAIYANVKPIFQTNDVKESNGIPSKTNFNNESPIAERDEVERALDFDNPGKNKQEEFVDDINAMANEAAKEKINDKIEGFEL